jgi:hypothetical protein
VFDKIPVTVYIRHGAGHQENEERIIEILEFSCPYGRIAHERDTLEFTYNQKKAKYAELAKAISEIEQKEVRVTAIIISSMGAVYQPSLKDLQKVLKCSDHEIRKIGKHMSETVIKGSLEIWRQDMKTRHKEREEEQEEVQEVIEEIRNFEEEEMREHGEIIERIERREDQDQTEEEGTVEGIVGEMESERKGPEFEGALNPSHKNRFYDVLCRPSFSLPIVNINPKLHWSKEIRREAHSWTASL